MNASMTMLKSDCGELLSHDAANDVGRKNAGVTQAHLDLVQRIARTLARRLPSHVELDELIALGNLGLVEARARYKADRGVPFDAFASPRIRGAMLDGLRNNDPLTREERARCKRETDAVAPVTLVELTSWCDESISRADVDGAHETLEKRERIAELHRALATLTGREREVVRRYFIEEESLKSVGADLGVSESRICQIARDAVTKLRAAMSITSTEVVRPAPARRAAGGCRRRNVEGIRDILRMKVELAELVAALRPESERAEAY